VKAVANISEQDRAELVELVSLAAPSDWKAAWVRAEVTDGSGAIDFYVRMRSGVVRHVTSVPGLSMKLFDWAYRLPPCLPGQQLSWSTCVAAISDRASMPSVSFGFEDVSSPAGIERRRKQWEVQTFGDAVVVYDPM
jgi:hypothetical protein